MNKYREPNTWIDKINLDVMPYVDAPEWENRYPTLSALVMNSAGKRELQSISAGLVQALSRLVEALRANSGKMPFDLFNMTDKLTPYILGDNAAYVSYLCRLDFVKDVSGSYKLVEINADTPCALPETFYANKVAEKYFANLHQLQLAPRSDGAELAEPFLRLLEQPKYANCDMVRIAFAADRAYSEDWANAKFMYERVLDVLRERVMSRLPVSCRLIGLEQLVVHDDGVYVPNEITHNEERIDILYRLHPLELLMDDESEDGYPVGLKLMELANFGAVDLVNPVKSIVLQNKALMALAWYLYQHRLFWTPEEEQLIGEHLTPTYLDSAALRGKRYIKKPIFGREGAGIAIVEADGQCSYEAEECDDCDLIYQQFMPSADVQQEADNGTVTGKYTYSCFVVDGRASETFVRLQPGEITGVDAYFVPILDEK